MYFINNEHVDMGNFFIRVINRIRKEFIYIIYGHKFYNNPFGINLLTIDETLDYISKNGLISISPVKYGMGSLAMPRKQEIIACFNRYRNLKL